MLVLLFAAFVTSELQVLYEKRGKKIFFKRNERILCLVSTVQYCSLVQRNTSISDPGNPFCLTPLTMFRETLLGIGKTNYYCS